VVVVDELVVELEVVDAVAVDDVLTVLAVLAVVVVVVVVVKPASSGVRGSHPPVPIL